MLIMNPKTILVLTCVLLCSCGDALQTPSLDSAGEQFVKLGLELGEYDDLYVDSYVGPDSWREHARENPRSRQALAQAISQLLETVEAFEPSTEKESFRRRMLLDKVRAMDARARMLNGESFTFAEEANLLLGVIPPPADFREFDRVLAEIENIVPGEGALNDRIDALRSRVIVPDDKIDAVFRRAIQECRERTLAHIDLPEDERFRLEYVSGVSWGGFLEYLGDHESLMSINTDIPITPDMVVFLACHEGYPGHHVYNLLVDQRYLQELAWVEFQLQPLFAPSMLIHEGSAQYAAELAFPGAESVAFQRDVLAPLAQIDRESVEGWNEYLILSKPLGVNATSATAQRYLDGEINRGEAVQERARYGMRTASEAERSVRFIEDSRSYVLNYSVGQDLVSRYVEARSDSEEAKWLAFQRLIEDQPAVSDLSEEP